jgi:hypothetical protein
VLYMPARIRFGEGRAAHVHSDLTEQDAHDSARARHAIAELAGENSPKEGDAALPGPRARAGVPVVAVDQKKTHAERPPPPPPSDVGNPKGWRVNITVSSIRYRS